MAILANKMAAGLLSGGLILTGAGASEAQESPRPVDGASLAETLGLPIGGAKFHFWNEGTQTSGRLACDVTNAQPDLVQCRLDLSSAITQMESAQSITFSAKDASIISRLTGSREWDGGDYRSTTNYKKFYRKIDSDFAWSETSPLATHTPEGILQSRVKMVEGANDALYISSDVPVSEHFGLRLQHSFDQATHEIQSTAMPIVSGNYVLTFADSAKSEMNPEDAEYMERNQKYLPQNGGSGFKSVIAQTP